MKYKIFETDFTSIEIMTTSRIRIMMMNKGEISRNNGGESVVEVIW